ncbi:hypothetical protein Tsubulata_048171 [Turnera subulata]|uniref:Glutamyl/glutaminyl-tRNA synthetase class Ib catalytic domain-containing protein n=1 Tax=Turnera subulata TaxID=218843 RepID=A0A9Q0GCE7_9ROSI|nr:hypothetical protein Tsubulata_048171 [Turnera subulata]
MDGIESKWRNNSIYRGESETMERNDYRIREGFEVLPSWKVRHARPKQIPSRPSLHFVDALEGITHALRSSEYHDRNAQYERILQDMGLRKVNIYEFSRLLIWFIRFSASVIFAGLLRMEK